MKTESTVEAATGVQRRLQPRFLQPNNYHGYAQVAGNVAVFLLLIAAARFSGSTWLSFLLVIASGFAIHRLFFPLHDCIHDSLFKSKFENRLFGNLLSALLGTPFAPFREQHLDHHRYFATLEDPGAEDYYVRFGSRREMLLFFIEPLLGITLLRRLISYLKRLKTGSYRRNSAVVRPENKSYKSVGLLTLVTVHLGLCAFVTSGFNLSELWRYPVFILIPGVTIFLFLNRLRMFLEHGSLDYEKSDYLSGRRPTYRTIYASPLERLLIVGGNFNYHHEHHRYPKVPGWILPQLHREFTGPTIDPEDVRISYTQAFLELWKYLGRSQRPIVAATSSDTHGIEHHVLNRKSLRQ